MRVVKLGGKADADIPHVRLYSLVYGERASLVYLRAAFAVSR